MFFVGKNILPLLYKVVSNYKIYRVFAKKDKNFQKIKFFYLENLIDGGAWMCYNRANEKKEL